MYGAIAVAFLFILLMLGHWSDQLRAALSPEIPIRITADFDYASEHYHHEVLSHTQTSAIGGGGLGHGSDLQRFIVPLHDGAGLLIILNEGFVIRGDKAVDLKLASWIWLNNRASPTRMIVNWASEPHAEKPEIIGSDNSIAVHIQRDKEKSYTVNVPIAGFMVGLDKPTEGLFFGGLDAALLQGDQGKDLRALTGWQTQPDGCAVLLADNTNSASLTKVSRRFPITHYGVLDHDMTWHIESTEGSHRGHLFALGRETVTPVLNQMPNQRVTAYVKDIRQDGITCHIPDSWRKNAGDIAIAAPEGKWIITLTPSSFWTLIPQKPAA